MILTSLSEKDEMLVRSIEWAVEICSEDYIVLSIDDYCKFCELHYFLLKYYDSIARNYERCLRKIIDGIIEVRFVQKDLYYVRSNSIPYVMVK